MLPLPPNMGGSRPKPVLVLELGPALHTRALGFSSEKSLKGTTPGAVHAMLVVKAVRRGQAHGRHASAHTPGSGLLLLPATGHVPKAKSLSSGQNKPGHINIFPPEALPLEVPALPLWIPSTHARSAPEMF